MEPPATGFSPSPSEAAGTLVTEVSSEPARRGRRLVSLGAWFAAIALVYVAVNFGLVWRASQMDQARRVQAIVVLGSAQYNGQPSPDLTARLNQALELYRRHLAPLVVVTGGSEPGDPYSEASVSGDYLADHGVPRPDILWEIDGRNTWQSLDAMAAFLRPRGVHSVLLVSDPFHDERIILMSRQLGLRPFVSPTRASPIRGRALVPYFVKETLEVSAGRIVGFRAIDWVEKRMGAR